MKKLMMLSCACALMSSTALARWVFKFPEGETTAYWDDAARWTNDGGTHAVPTGSDCICEQSGTIFITNTVPYVWEFRLNASTNGTPLMLQFKPDATNNHEWSSLVMGQDAGKGGMVQIDAGATYSGGLTVGRSGSGIVTNLGTVYYGNEIVLGEKAGSWGRLVCCDGGTVRYRWAKDLYVGRKGRGELLVRNSTFDWYYWSAKNGDVVVGESSAGGVITLETNSLFKVQMTYLGGRDAGAAGVGEIRLRGGTFVNNKDNWTVENGMTNHVDNLRMGTCPTAEGGVDAASRGVIRGWGRIVGNNVSRTGVRGIRAALGYGEIVGDGEGDESHVLDTCEALYTVSNALPADVAAETTSGWRAVNKGLVELPNRSCFWNGSTWNGLVAYPGCAKERGVDNLLPDLVNAVRIRASGTTPGYDKCFSVAVLAPDRADAYTNALPAGCNVLSVHRMGVFNNPSYRDTAHRVSFSTANVAIRYDQTKILKPNTRLELWRYSVAAGKWTRLVGLEAGERPAGKVIAMADDAGLTDDLDEVYNIGTFAVVEREVNGTVFLLR